MTEKLTMSMTKKLTEDQIDYWRAKWNEANTNEKWIAYHQQRDTNRITIRQELLHLLEQFLQNQIKIQQFKNIFDKRTRTDWDVFGLKGTSGAMFLNKMVKHVPDSALLTEHLQVALTAPKEVASGQHQMQGFFDFLINLISNGVAKQHLSPGYTPFFLSAWWHFQDPELWPIFYVSGRRALGQQLYYSESTNVIQNYFAFRAAFLEIAARLGLHSWQLEHLFSWVSEQGQTFTEQEPEALPKTDKKEASSIEDETPDELPEGSSHTEIQWLLAKIGRRLRCQVWIAANDHSKVWAQESLGELSMKSLPSLGLDEESQRIIRLIDVLWIKGANQVVAAFEIESTTSIYSGLLRMSDLTVSSPNINFPLYIVAPENRLDKVRRELSRPTFQALELNQRCGFFAFEELIKQSDAMMMWATDPSIIERLAHRVGGTV